MSSETKKKPPQRTCPVCRTRQPLWAFKKADPEFRCKTCVKLKAKAEPRQNIEPRFHRALAMSKGKGKRGLQAKCLATARELQDSYTGICEICGISEEEIGRAICLDHCHITGKFRGWLCTRCNTGIGQFQDDVGLMQEAIECLEKSRRVIGCSTKKRNFRLS